MANGKTLISCGFAGSWACFDLLITNQLLYRLSYSSMAFSVFVFCRMGLMGQGVAAAPLPPRTVDAAPSKGPRSFSRGTGPAQRGEIYQRPLVFYHKRQGKVKTYLGAGRQREGKKPGGPLLVWTEPCPRGLFPGEQTEVSFKKTQAARRAAPVWTSGGCGAGGGLSVPVN